MRRLWCKESSLGKLESGSLSVHAMRIIAQEVRHTYFEGQVTEYGHVDGGSSREHETQREQRREQGLQSQKQEARYAP